MATTVTEIKGARSFRKSARGGDIITRMYRVDAAAGPGAGERDYRYPDQAVKHNDIPSYGKFFGEDDATVGEQDKRTDLFVQEVSADHTQKSRFVTDVEVTYAGHWGGMPNEILRRWTIGTRSIQVDVDISDPPRACGMNTFASHRYKGEPAEPNQIAQEDWVDPNAILTKERLIAEPTLDIQKPQGAAGPIGVGAPRIPSPPVAVIRQLDVSLAMMTRVNSSSFQGMRPGTVQYVAFQADEVRANTYVFNHFFRMGFLRIRNQNGNFIEVMLDEDWYWEWELDVFYRTRTPYAMVGLKMYERGDLNGVFRL